MKAISLGIFRALPWFPVAVLSIYVKFAALGWQIPNLRTAFTGPISGADLSHRTGFFISDIVFGFVLVPAVINGLYGMVPPRAARRIVCFASLFLAALLFVQLQCLNMVGQFPSWRMLRDTATFLRSDPAVGTSYLKARAFQKFGGLVVAIIVATLLTGRFARGRESAGRGPLVLGLAGLLCFGACSAGDIYYFSATPLRSSVVSRIVLAVLDLSSDAGSKYEALDIRTLNKTFHDVSNTPTAFARSPYSGGAKDFDVILLILETAPVKLFEGARFDEYPALKELAQRSFIGLRHHTPYPLTNRAIFSLLSSWYPVNTSMNVVRLHPGILLPGVAHSLVRCGYETAFVSPSSQKWDRGDEMYRALGIRRLLFPDLGSVAKEHADRDGPGAPATGLPEDLASFGLLRRFISENNAADRRYLAVFAPQIGHAPWRDPEHVVPERGIWERGKAVIRLEDTWVAELVADLRSRGKLESTIIAVTGDHGIRTKNEDPGFHAGRADEISFQVPFLLFVPQVLRETVAVPWLTSHIDLAPTVLELVGCGIDRELEQGVPIWERGAADRTHYFMAKNMMGIDAFYRHSTFSMQSYFSGAFYSNEGTFHFGDEAILAPGSPDAEEVRTVIAEMNAFQYAWVRNAGMSLARSSGGGPSPR